MAERSIGFTVRQAIGRPVAEVFRAVVEPEKLCSYFTATASAPLEAGSTVRWTWEGGEADTAHVHDVIPDRRIVLGWKAYRVDYETRCVFEFEASGEGRTVIRVSESGWQNDPEGRASSYEHCQGWTHMLLCLKAWLEHDIDLR
jgi:uncharacterized protein YndB with AHSA1/START domain